MSLITASEARPHVPCALTDAELQGVIDDLEAELIAKLGAHGDGATAATAIISGSGGDLFLPRPAASVTSIDGTAWAALGSGFTLLASEGRITGARWAGAVTVVYVPADDRPRRRRALINLLRLEVNRTAMRAESVAGEYSATAPDWEEERASVYRRLMYPSI